MNNHLPRAARLATVMLAATLAAASAARAETFTLWARSDEAPFIATVVNAYNKSHDDKVRLSIVVAQQLVQKFAVAEAAGSAPDALSLDLIYTPAFAAAGQLQDITDWARALPYFAKLSPAHLKVATYRDRLYGVPFSAEASILLYNKALFRKAGLDPDKPPASWAELRDDAEKIAGLGGDVHGWYLSAACGGCQAFELTPFVWASGGGVLSDDGRTVTLNSPEVQGAVGLYRDLVAHAGVPASAQTDNGSNALTGFVAGKVGMQNLGAFAIGTLTTKYKSIEFGVAPIPGKDGGHASFAGGDNIVLTKGTQKQGAVKAFVEWAYTLDAQRLMVANGSLPVRADLAAQALSGVDPRYAVPALAMQEGRTPFSAAYNDLFNSNNGPWTEALGRAIYGADPNAALAKGQARMQAIVDRSRK